MKLYIYIAYWQIIIFKVKFYLKIVYNNKLIHKLNNLKIFISVFLHPLIPYYYLYYYFCSHYYYRFVALIHSLIYAK